MQNYPSCKHREGAWRDEHSPADGGRYAGTFPGEPGQIGRVRAGLREYLGGCPRSDDAVLIASELAANAVLHSRSAGRVLHRPGRGAPRLASTLRWKTSAARGCAGSSRTGGTGLDIVTALAADWGIETSGGCRSTWARVTFHG